MWLINIAITVYLHIKCDSLDAKGHKIVYLYIRNQLAAVSGIKDSLWHI